MNDSNFSLVVFAVWVSGGVLVLLGTQVLALIDYVQKYQEWIINAPNEQKPRYSRCGLGDDMAVPLIFFWPFAFMVFVIAGPFVLLGMGISKLFRLFLNNVERKIITKHKALILTSSSEQVRELIEK